MPVRQPGLTILKNKLAIFDEIAANRPLTDSERRQKADILFKLSKAADA